MQPMQRTGSEHEREVSLIRAIYLHCCVFPARDSDTRLISCLFTKNVMSSLRGKQISWQTKIHRSKIDHC